MLAIVSIWTYSARATDIVPELAIGPVATSIDGTVYVGLGIGGGGILEVLPTSLGPLQVRLATMPVFGSDPGSSFTITHVHVPLTLALAFQELPRDRKRLGVGGAIGVGVTGTLGRLHERSVVQPSAMVEVTLGMFQRGAFTVRYQTTIADVISPARGRIGYHSLVLIASTAW